MTLALQGDSAQTHGCWWNDGDAWRSRLFDAVSLLLPSGEQFTIDAIEEWRAGSMSRSPSNAFLWAEAGRFVAEERAHQRAHRLYNRRLQAHAPADVLERRIADAVCELKTCGLRTRLALAAAFEHWTALLSAEILRPGGVWLAEEEGQGESLQTRLWRWHCREEIGHHRIAFEVMRAAGVGPLRRNLAAIAAALFLGVDLLRTLAALSLCDLRARRVEPLQLLGQAARWALRVLPGLARTASGGLRYMVGGGVPH